MRSLPPPRLSRRRRIRRILDEIIFYLRKGYINDANAFQNLTYPTTTTNATYSSTYPGTAYHNTSLLFLKHQRKRHQRRAMIRRTTKKFGRHALMSIPGGQSTIETANMLSTAKNGVSWVASLPKRAAGFGFLFG